jgi:hypothetical protein
MPNDDGILPPNIWREALDEIDAIDAPGLSLAPCRRVGWRRIWGICGEQLRRVLLACSGSLPYGPIHQERGRLEEALLLLGLIGATQRSALRHPGKDPAP